LNPLKKLVNRFTGQPKMGANYIGAPSFREVNPYGFFDLCESDTYASAYPSIRAISYEYMTIRPYAIDSNGKTVQNNPIVNALYHPNQLDSSVSFAEKVAVSTLVLPKTYLLVWRNERGEAKPGGDFGVQGRNIAGFTFLERPAISIRDNVTYYSMGSQEFTQDEVIVLPGGVDPHNLYGGYSPNIAAKKWSTLDDYIADFQKGFFQNNAIPAGHFIITAASEQDYKDTVKRMKDKHQGAGNNNNVTYTPRPIGQDGKPADAKIEWIPFAQANKDIDFKNLFEQANKRLDLAFGVPAIVKGIDDAATYANAQVAEKTFAKRAVYPLALRNYTQITHELNRITGGIGIAITFKYDIPTVADELYVNAQTTEVQFRTLKTAVDAGFTLESSIDAFELPTNFKLLKVGEESTTVIENDKPDVDEGDEIDNSPNPTKIDGVTPLSKGGIVKDTVTIAIDTSCDNTIIAKKIIDSIEAAKSTNPKAEMTDEEKLEEAARQYMQEQVDRAVREYLADPEGTQASVKMQVQPEPTQAELDAFVIAMTSIVTGILLEYGEDGYAIGVALAGLNASELQGFTLTETAEDAYIAYLRRVGTTYGNDTAESIRKALADARDRGLTVRDTQDAIHNIMDTDQWRVDRLARTELNNAQNIGKLEGMKSLAAEAGGTWEKTIDHSGVTPCPLCQSQEGIWTILDQPLWQEGQTIIAPNESGEEVIYVNDWQTDEASDYHPNGRGTLIFRRSE
jgi:phage portal protein BeeE